MTLGIDIGTTSSKATLLGEDLGVVASARVAHAVSYPRPGFAEQNAEVWWDDLLSLIRLLSRKADLSRVRALGVSSMGPVVLPLSSAGEPLRSAMLYGIDSRATEQIARLNRTLGKGLTDRVLTAYSSQSILPKLLWLKENQYPLFGRIAKIAAVNGYVAYRLTGRLTLDYFTASAGALVDFPAGGLYEEGFKTATLDSGLIPELVWPGEVVGVLGRHAAEATGLPRGIPVIAGSTDAAAEAVISGCTLPRKAALSLGGTTIYVACNDVLLSREKIFVCSFLSPESYIYGGASGSGGLLLDWFARNFLKCSPGAMAKLFPDVEGRATRALVLPYLNGARTPLNDPAAMGLISGLDSTSGPEDLYIALVEALAFDLAMMVEEIDDCAPAPGTLRATGGGTRNPFLLRTIAEVLKKDLESLAPEMGAAAGVALLAAAALGERSLEESLALLPVNTKVPYRGERAAYLSAKKELFMKAYQANAPIFRDIRAEAGLNGIAR